MALLVVLVVLAVYRVTRFIVLDAFPPMEWFRLAIERKLGPDHPIAYLVNCAWCTSVYVAAAMVWATDELVEGGLIAPVLVAAVASAVSGLLTAIEPE